MRGEGVLHEELLATSRLQLHYAHWQPHGSVIGRILFLGGSNFDLALKREIFGSMFAQCYEIVTYEPRGIGRSDRPDGEWAIQDYAEDAVSVLDAMGWDAPIVIGESFGGMTALHLAKLAPERVANMVVTSATAGGAGGSSFDLRKFLTLSRRDAAREALLIQDTRNNELAKSEPEAFDQKWSKRTALEEAFFESSIRHGGYARLLEARAGHDAWEALPDIATSTLVVAGTFDAQAPIAAQRAMAEALPNAELYTYPAGHGVLFSDESVATHIVTNWLRPRRTDDFAEKGLCQ